MIKSFLSLKSEAFGLDISDLSLKIVNLKKKDNGLALSSFGSFPIKPGVLSGGEVKDEQSLAGIINSALKNVKGDKLRSRHIVASLPEEKSFLQVIKMPNVSKENLKSAVTYEAENYIPLPIESVYIDSQVVSSVSNKENGVDVLIVALPRKIVDAYMSVFKRAGLVASALEIESQSVARALVKNQKSAFPILLIDFGATKTGLSVFLENSLRFTSSIPVSSSGFTKIISRSLKIDITHAEELKIRCGLNNKTEEEKKVFESLIPSLTDLLEQVKKHIDYYQEHINDAHLSSENKKIKKIILCGGGAVLPGFVNFISTEINLPVELGNPWVNILPDPLREIPGITYKESLKYTVALGLALRGVNLEM